MNADINLFSVSFGESVFNDAVALVMYEIVVHSGGKSIGAEIGAGIGTFCYVFFLSILVGALIALFTAFVLKKMKEKSNRQLAEREIDVRRVHENR